MALFKKPYILSSSQLDAFYDRALVPYIDLFNHAPGSRSRIELTKNALYLTCNEDVAEGGEIFIDYGPHSNLKLLRQYGFTIKDNMYGVVKLNQAEVLESIKRFTENKTHCDETHLTFTARSSLIKKYKLLSEPFTVQSGKCLLINLTC